MMRGKPTEISPRFEVEFCEPVKFGDHMSSIMDIVWFFSFSTGLPLRPENITISSKSWNDLLNKSEESQVPDQYEVLYNFPKEDRAEKSNKFWLSIFNCRDPEETDNLKFALSSWLRRSQSWKNANLQMMECLRRENTIDSDRLLEPARKVVERYQ